MRPFCIILRSFFIVASLSVVPRLAHAESGMLGIPVDKYAHFGIAATAHTTCSAAGKAITNSKWTSAIVCYIAVNGVAAGKAIADIKGGANKDEKTHDEFANIAGSSLSFVVVSIAF